MAKQISFKRLEEKLNYGFIIIITIVLTIIIALNVILIYGMTAEQTQNVGKTRLESIASELQGTISDAKNMTMCVATGVEFLLQKNASTEELEDYFVQQKALQGEMSEGVCINVYVAGEDWMVIPDFEVPQGFVPQERIWYEGAVESGINQIFISPPYADLAAADMCFTLSMLLADGKTVVALDFNLSKVQDCIQEMCSDGNGDALIVNSDQMIVGYTDTSFVGHNMRDSLPEYENIFRKIAAQEEKNVSLETKMDGKKSTVFCTQTENDWYLIFSVNDWALYRNSYLQLFRNSVLNLLLVAVIILFYLMGYRNKVRAERALATKEEFLAGLSSEFRAPLNRIIKFSNYEMLKQSENPREDMDAIREAGFQLSSMMDNLFLYSSVETADREKQKKTKKHTNADLRSKGSYHVRIGIIGVLMVTMIITIIGSTRMVISWGNTKMHREADIYNYQLSEWMAEQKGILDMFVHTIAARPGLLEDYEGAVEYLDNITKKYSEISVTYITNPEYEHTVIMNNGWEPEDDWHVEERQWYVDTLASEDGFSISAPYYDEQTGFYCVTFSEIIYGEDGEFLGIFGIDFYLDKLIEILGESYTEDGYAFLVDSDGIIINHPNHEYQLSSENSANINALCYNVVYDNSDIQIIRDYDDLSKVCVAELEPSSNFRIVVVKNWWTIYGNTIVYGVLFLILFGCCVGAVTYLMHRLMKWQADVNIRLQEAAESAVQAGKAKSQFLAQMSHEIRTPINAVLGMNEMILRESEDDNIREYSGNIQSAGRTLLTLINSILDFSKIEDGKMEIIPVKYDTCSMINDLVNMVADKAEKKGLNLILEIDENLPKTLYGDDVRVRQVITNILTNAVKYTPEGSITLRIRAVGRDVDLETILLRVEVIDTGIGIREEDMDKLFQSFQRLDEEKNRNIEGTGLGISIVQKLLVMMGSRLEVRSVYGQGSNFSFELAQKVVEAEPIGDYGARHRESMESRDEQSYIYAPDARILIVDDNAMNLKVAAGLLKRNGMKLDTAISGKECIDKVKNISYDIIFLDHMMPEMDGIETLRCLRTAELLPENTVVIAMTANAIVGAREEYLKEGFDDYVSKPIEINKLEKQLKQYLPPEKVSVRTIEKTQEKPIPEETRESLGPAEIPSDTFTQEELMEIHAKAPDLDVITGLTYCAGSKMFYMEMLREYCNSPKAEEIEKFMEQEDMENYRILVHALKSTSLSIGAVLLSEMARQQEMAAKEGRIEFVRKHHREVMEKYRELMEELKIVFGGIDIPGIL